ncbi:tRNA-dependent cyclodipeptide synthase [Streptomyces sp. NPDC047999]|uniref:tRNA-dependent cyclodipeptide synthase n=1 Tax=Streptomyces sp. NPDC047999 TaxID=3365497 RepID=UPI0037245CB0
MPREEESDGYISEFTAEPITSNCRSIYRRREHLVVVVSPGNSYFRTPIMTRLLDWADRTFRHVAVLHPDTGLECSFTAIGYSPDRARLRARREISQSRRRVRRAWDQANVPIQRRLEVLVSEFMNHPAYRSVLKTAEEQMQRDLRFRTMCQGVTRDAIAHWALHAGRQIPHLDDPPLDYILAELPFFLASPQILQTSSSTMCYHRRLEFIEYLYRSGGPLKPKRNQGFVRLRSAHPAEGQE